MNLIDAMMEPCVLYNRISEDDGAGGLIDEWQEGAHFSCAITMDATMEAERAQKEGVTSIYTVTTHKNVRLPYNSVFKRLKDGLVFRTTSAPEDKTVPVVSTLDIVQVKAERWNLTT